LKPPFFLGNGTLGSIPYDAIMSNYSNFNGHSGSKPAFLQLTNEFIISLTRRKWGYHGISNHQYDTYILEIGTPENHRLDMGI
jgi:hypothetical protein